MLNLYLEECLIKGQQIFIFYILYIKIFFQRKKLKLKIWNLFKFEGWLMNYLLTIRFPDKYLLLPNGNQWHNQYLHGLKNNTFDNTFFIVLWKGMTTLTLVVYLEQKLKQKREINVYYMCNITYETRVNHGLLIMQEEQRSKWK